MKNTVLFCCLSLFSMTLRCQDLVTDKKEENAFPVVSLHYSTAIYADGHDHWLVQKAAALLQQDIERVTGRRPELLDSLPRSAENLIIIGSLDRSPLIGRLAKEHKIITAQLKGKWEAFSLQVVSHPMNGIGRALVITGSDRRGTAYGVFELSRQMGVSPWYWWADVPVKKKDEVYVRSGDWQYGPPAVKYRGFFINDEAPAFSGWTRAKFGGVNHQVYEKIFELLLRMKANYLWPAMWNNAFNDDDTLNPVMADQYGIVMGTSHHEPMLRAQQEWKRYGSGPWNYVSNEDTLKAFWKKGIQHMGSHESILTIGMRGDGDKPMTEGSPVELLERIVKDQRSIIREVTGKAPSATPQLWALYKEVQDYYDKGMRVPDDVTLLLCDDNWGNIRKLPRPGSAPRGGGYGIYYHFDYVGGPRNYKWLNTNPISRVWEQMHLALQYGVDKIWIVNVGDIKPMEFPISFFMDYAWDPGKWPASRLEEYTREWAAAQFGPDHAEAIAGIITKYTFYNGRRKPELLSPDTYSLDNYQEAETVVADYNRLATAADSIYREMPDGYKDAYYQLVLYPVKACANLNELYVTVARNRRYAAEGRAEANELAERARALFAEDSALAHYYNKVMAGGKWDHMMDQTHIGYTYWQQPPTNKMPEVRTIAMGKDGDAGDPDRSGRHGEGLRNGGTSGYPKPGNSFLEKDGYISMEAAHYAQALAPATMKWLNIPDLGRTLSGMEIMPMTVSAQTPGAGSPRLEYRIYLYDTGRVKIQAYFSPTLDLTGTGLLRYGLSIDEEVPQILNLAEGINERGVWDKWVSDNIIIKTSEHHIDKPGLHLLKYWLVDPGPVLQKIVVDAGGVKPSYLGPPESDRTGFAQAAATASPIAASAMTASSVGDSTGKGLKDYYKDYFPIGVSVMPGSLTGPDAALILQQFNSITPENAMKMGPIHPQENHYYWKDADSIVNFAQAHGLRIRGHNLCWHENTPGWLFRDSLGNTVTKTVLLQRLKDHIMTVVGRYKGEIYAWDVVNEAIADDSTQLLRNSPWYRICGDEFIAKAFEYAHEADPAAQLFYNDYNTERPEKRERVYRLLKQLVDAGAPIAGVGIQAHWSIYEPSEKELITSIRRFSSLGLKVQITELDMSIYPWEKERRKLLPGESDSLTADLEQKQADQYRKVFAVFRDFKGLLNGVTFWNISDRDSWLNRYPVAGRRNYPLLFDRGLQPKKAYWEVVKY